MKNNDKFNKLYNDLLNTSFPQNTSLNEEVGEFFIELLDYDSYLAGFFERYHKYENIEKNHIIDPKALIEKGKNIENLLEYNIIEKEILRSYLDYLYKIQGVFEEMDGVYL